MSAKEGLKKIGDFVANRRVEIAGLAVTGVTVASASAASLDINGTVGPILDQVIGIIPNLIDLIVAIVPAIIVLAVVGFIVAFFDKILGMMRM
jgi:hypothetical protein